MFKSNLIRPKVMVFAALMLASIVVAACGNESANVSNGDDLGYAPQASVGEVNKLSLDADGGSGGVLPQAADRKITRTATIELSVEDVASSVQSIDDIAAAAGGFVSGSSIFVEERPELRDQGESVARRTQAGTITIRVPSDAYAGVMTQLRGIADEVVSETSDASEVTEQYTDLQARLRNLQATEASYLKLLEQATAIPDILTVQDRLNPVRLEIEQVQGQINVLDDLTALATITVRLNQPPPLVTGDNEGWVKEAWNASLEVAEGAMIVGVSVGIFVGVSLLWLVPLFLVIMILWLLLGRRIFGSLHRLLSVD